MSFRNSHINHMVKDGYGRFPFVQIPAEGQKGPQVNFGEEFKGNPQK